MKGCVIVLKKNKLFGTCTDGDIRSITKKNKVVRKCRKNL